MKLTAKVGVAERRSAWSAMVWLSEGPLASTISSGCEAQSAQGLTGRDWMSILATALSD